MFIYINDFFALIHKISSNIPHFDIRLQLLFFGFGLPLIADICMWFINPFVSTIFHILDLVAIGCLTYFLSYSQIAPDCFLQ